MNMETDTQEYIHRLQFCCKAIKNLGLGELHVLNVGFKPVYQLVNRRNVGTYKFQTLDRLERFIEKSMSRHTSVVMSDRSMSRRMNMRREEKFARANGKSYYTFPSAV